MRKAQISMEYMIIVGFVTAVTIPLILIFSIHSAEMNENIISNQVDHIASKIVDSAESVYYLGNSSKVTFQVRIPKNVDSISLGNNEVVFYVKQRNGIDHVVKFCSVPVNGSISYEPGIHNIIIESKGDYVWVSN